MKLSLGFSPCPNDTFIFDALIHHKIDTEGLEFEVQLGDVEWLNKKAFRHELDITKLSYHAYLYLVEHYILMTSGSALGNNCGGYDFAKRPQPQLLDVGFCAPHRAKRILLTVGWVWAWLW